MHVEHDLDGHVVDFENLQLAAFAEFGYVLHRPIQGIRSFVIHPCTRRLLRVLVMGRVVGFVERSVVRGLEES